ncbi:MAG: hypothetical protein IT529_14555 [Burkholderiales bacterium]|nr:hypothetical protein [Burkholderiales bacterium]
MPVEMNDIAHAMQTVELAGADYEHTPSLDGVVDGVVIKYTARPVTEIFGSMIGGRSFEACEFSLSSHIPLKDRGAEWLEAIPVFPNRGFRHGTLVVRRESDLVDPVQLRGRKIGVFHAYAGAKASAYGRRVGATMIPWGKRMSTDVFDFFGGDPLPYGLTEANRKVIAKLVEYLHEQKLISGRPDVDALFVRGSMAYRER